MGPNIDIQATGSVMQETTHTELNSPKEDISSCPSSTRVSGKENPPIQECSVAEVKSARTLHSSSGISTHVRKAATQRRKRDATGAAGKPAACIGSTPFRTPVQRKEKLPVVTPASITKLTRINTARQLEHRGVLQGDDLEPGSPHTSVGSVHSFVDEDFRQNPHDDGVVDNIKVIIRIRPRSFAEREEAERDPKSGISCLNRLSITTLSVATPHHEPHSYTFDHIADELTAQEDMFCLVGAPVIENVMAGFNSSIFAYGQTGSGKTHTILGQPCDPDQRGLAPRMLERLFQRISEEEDRSGRDVRYSCRCSFLEIYNESISDLLNTSAVNLQLREDVKRGCYVDGLSDHIVLNQDDAMALILRGAENRRVSETRMNRESSRSHSVFTCTLESSTRSASGITSIRFSRLNIIDLAGSERNKTSGATGDHFREACLINRSLTTLGRVIMELVEAQRQQRKASHIPYRDSRLTFLLQDSLGGNAKTVVIANVSPAASSACETNSTLQFASRAKYIRNKAVVNEDTQGDMDLLRREIQRLTRELEIVHSESREPLLRENHELRCQLDEMHIKSRDSSEQVAKSTAELIAIQTELRLAEPRLRQLEMEKETATTQASAMAGVLRDIQQALSVSCTPWEDLDVEAFKVESGCLMDKLLSEQSTHAQVLLDLEHCTQKVVLVEERLASSEAHSNAILEEHAAREEGLRQEIQSLRDELLATEGANDALLSRLQAAQERMKAIAEDADALRSEMARAREAEQAAATEARTAYANALAATQEAATEAHRLVSASDAAHAAEIGRMTKDIEDARGECHESRTELKRLAGEIGTLTGQLSASRAETIAAQAMAQHLVQEHAAKVSGLEKTVAKMQMALAESKGKEETNQSELRRLRRDSRDAAARGEALERQHAAEVTELKRAFEEAQTALESLRQEASHEANRSAKYRRALADIDDLILWARNSPSAAKSGGHSGFRIPRPPSIVLPSPQRPASTGAAHSQASYGTNKPRPKDMYPLTVKVDNPAYMSPTACYSPAASVGESAFASACESHGR
eukprot:jgi/Botrbrau1/21215/Bobra.39_2s0016.1